MLNWTALLAAKDWNERSPWTHAQRKCDGLRILLRHKDPGRFDAFTRNGKTDVWPLIASRADWVRKIVPAYSALDCEVFVEGVHATSVISHLKDRTSDLDVMAFAIPWWDGKDFRSMDWRAIDKMADALCIPYVPTYHRSHLPDSRDALAEFAVRKGWEGLILKERHYAGWWKVKPVQTMDLRVAGYTLSTSDSFAGGLKAIQVVDENGEEMASVGSGFDVEWRMSVDPETLIGRVAEIAFDSLAANGKLKFPRFVRWRDDK